MVKTKGKVNQKHVGKQSHITANNAANAFTKTNF